MGRKVHPIVKMRVAWSPHWEFTHGLHDGLPLLPYGWAPKHLLATVRQLKKLGLRPGGQDPVAVMWGYSRAGGCKWFASLYLIANAKPMLAMTPRKWMSLEKANLARRLCPTCGRDRGYIIPPTFGQCFVCVEASENLADATDSGVAA
jgi:hypothetical protein